jgi:hypothetical protein
MAAPSNYFFYFLTTAEYVKGGLRDVERGVVSPPREVGATVSYRF